MKIPAALCLLLLTLTAAAPQPDWRPLDPQNTLVIDTSKGRIVIEMRPDLAPKAVERIKLLAREKVYDGLLFHRVLPTLAQTGNPNNRDGGGSSHPDLAPEFTFRLAEGQATIVTTRSDGFEGLVGSVPVAGIRTSSGALRGWGAYCAGVVGMGRQQDVTSANSEIFLMSRPVRAYDHDYTVWGRVVTGLEVVRALEVGEPPRTPDHMLAVRLAADLPMADRPRLEVENEQGARLRGETQALRRRLGAAFSICDVPIHTRLPPPAG